MKRFAFAAALVLLVGAAFSVSFIMSAFAANEEYPTGTQSVTIRAKGYVLVSTADSTSTSTATQLPLAGTLTGTTSPHLMKFDLSSVPSGKAIVAAHLNVVVQKVSTAAAGDGMEVRRIMADWDSSTVTSTRRSGSTWWASDAVLTLANATADTTYEQPTVSAVRPSLGMMLTDASPATGDTLTADITGLVRGWYSGLWANYGLALFNNIPIGHTRSITLYTSKGSIPPWLTVRYVDPTSGGTAGRGRGVGEGSR